MSPVLARTLHAEQPNRRRPRLGQMQVRGAPVRVAASRPRQMRVFAVVCVVHGSAIDSTSWRNINTECLLCVLSMRATEYYPTDDDSPG